MTLDDIEGPVALCCKIHAFSEPTTKISMKIDSYYQRQRCSAMTSFRLYKVCAECCGYSREFVGDEASTDSGVIENVDFQGFQTYVFGILGSEANIII